VQAVKRPGNNPKRRVAEADLMTAHDRAKLAEQVRYRGSGHHKRSPADYGLERTNPRPTKSLCDLVKVVTYDEAKSLIKKGVLNGVFSDFRLGVYPKFVWCVDDDGEVYEAKTDNGAPGIYHGYRLEEDDDMHSHVATVWKKRCRPLGT
jgi:hypothetical protein